MWRAPGEAAIAKLHVPFVLNDATEQHAARFLLVAAAVLTAASPRPIQAQNFIVESGEVDATLQTLNNLGGDEDALSGALRATVRF